MAFSEAAAFTASWPSNAFDEGLNELCRKPVYSLKKEWA
jgi:hypothetical protein